MSASELACWIIGGFMLSGAFVVLAFDVAPRIALARWRRAKARRELEEEISGWRRRMVEMGVLEKDPHELIFRVVGYTGLDHWYRLLPPASQAVRVARRAYPDARRVVVELPTKQAFLVEGGKARQVPNPGLPF